MDSIKKEVLLKAEKPRVWRALTESKEFGAWFGMKIEGPFKLGVKMFGEIQPTTVDPEIAKMQEPYKGHRFELFVERMEPQDVFAIKWHPYAVDLNSDYSKEPMTTVTFTLAEKPGGTLLTIVESGFEKIPLARRADALKSNEGGWEAQCGLIAKYLAMHG